MIGVRVSGRFALTAAAVLCLPENILMSTGPIFQEVADKFDFVEISTLVIRLQIRRDSNPATITPLLRWLSTNHNLIDNERSSGVTVAGFESRLI